MTASKRRVLPTLPTSTNRVHLIGICGTGMGSLAGMLAEHGCDVRGSDRGAYPPMSTWLEARGISIMQGWDPAHLDWGPDLVIVGNVCRRDNPEAVEAVKRGLTCISFPEAIRVFFLKGKRPMVITGTHGKTTTSALLAWMLEYGGVDPSFMLGGITGNFGGNFKLGQGPLFVVEGDEYDSAYFDKVPKFWHYEPERATINNIEFDHGDIYPDIDSIVEVFEKFAAMLPPGGSLWINGDDARARDVARHAPCTVRTFGLGPGNDLTATDIVFSDTTEATIQLDGAPIGTLRSPIPGEHNIRNVLGAMAIAMDEGLTAQRCLDAMTTFKSVRKRQELRGYINGVHIYDDFAHHPTAVRETLKAIRARHAKARIWGIFEAKSNTSRMAIFQDAYPEAFATCNRVVLSAPWRLTREVYSNTGAEGPQKIELPQVVADIQALGIEAEFIPTVPEIIAMLEANLKPGDVVVGMSGSNFGNFHALLIERLEASKEKPA